MTENINKIEELLVSRFNRRDSAAFGEVYNILYKELHYYVATIYYGYEHSPSDIIHDIFIKLWSSKELKFTNLINLKVYMFSAVKNGFKNFLRHNDVNERYKKHIESDKNDLIEIIESEVYIQVQELLNMLPEEWSKILQLELEGWSTEDIAQLMNKKRQTIYNIKLKAIKTLKKKLNDINYSVIHTIFC